MTLDAAHADVTRIALTAAGHDFALAGGNALIAHGLLNRPTADVDLFSPLAGGAAQVADSVREALTEAGYTVVLVAGLSDGQVDFARFRVARGDTTVLLDLARDYRANRPVQLPVGPVLSLDDAVASKVAAMLGRGLPRDYIDVAAALDTYQPDHLLQLAFERDPGLRTEDAVAAMHQLDRLHDDEFSAYGLDAGDVTKLRQSFRAWARVMEPKSPSASPRRRGNTSRVQQPTRPPRQTNDGRDPPTRRPDGSERGR